MIDDLPLIGSQEPTYEWCPEWATTYGDEAAELYNAAASPLGQTLDVYQVAALRQAFAVDPTGTLLCFEWAIILSRQNGKGEILLALELAWLFLFGEPLIIHSAHLAETAREHFLKICILIQSMPDLERRVSKVREGKGAEEIVLKSGARLKFMTRSTGGGLGFTGSKLVADEAMKLDALVMGAGLPTMATKRNAQVIYAASAGDKDSSQLAAVRRRILDRDPAAGGMLWEADRPIYDDHGTLVAGDDPQDPRTWAKTNPTYGVRISDSYTRKEARTLGGWRSPVWWRMRLGIGDYPASEAAWKVIDRLVWEATSMVDVEPVLAPAGRALAVDADPETGVYTLGVAGRRADGRGHFEMIERKRGSEWVVDRVDEIRVKKGRRYPVVLLRSSIAAHLEQDLITRRFRVLTPTQTDYAAACQALVSDLGAGVLVHLEQPATTAAAGHADKRKGHGGSWVWDLDQPNQSPMKVATLAWWAVKSGLAAAPRAKVW